MPVLELDPETARMEREAYEALVLAESERYLQDKAARREEGTPDYLRRREEVKADEDAQRRSEAKEGQSSQSSTVPWLNPQPEAGPSDPRAGRRALKESTDQEDIAD